jgi:hypothetical protein
MIGSFDTSSEDCLKDNPAELDCILFSSCKEFTPITAGLFVSFERRLFHSVIEIVLELLFEFIFVIYREPSPVIISPQSNPIKESVYE